MTELDRLAVMIYKLFMHYEVELDDQVENKRHMLEQAPTPDMAQSYCYALQAREQFKDIANRVRSVLDFYKGDGV